MASVLHVVPDVQDAQERVPDASVLRVLQLSKEFRFYSHPWDRLVEWISAGRLQRSQIFVALKEVTFAVSQGRALGIIGANGAGKSTLLKIICGTLHPTTGRVEIAGRVASLLELGTGFHPDFTGRQNIVFNARFLGLSDEEIHERMASMIAFSELGEFIDRPLRTYSSGMQVRLAFAVVANVNPRILIIDEALAVGDAYFQQKCIRRIRQFREEGVTLLFVSHDPTAVKTLCDEALLLHHGAVIDRGRPEKVLTNYNTLIAREAGTRDILSLESKQGATEAITPQRSGSFAAVIEQINVCDAQGQECRSFLAGEEATITARVLCLEKIQDLTVGILIRDRLGNDVYGTNTYHQQIEIPPCQVGNSVEVVFRLALNLGPGEYHLTVAAHTFDTHIYDSFDWIERALVLKILPPLTGKCIGVAFLQPTVTYQQATNQREPERWEQTLALIFGQHFSRELQVAQAGKPWLFTGWHEPEGAEEAAFCWTQENFSFLLDLRGPELCLEMGTDRPDTGDEPVTVSAWIFDQPLEPLVMGGTERWALYSFPIPQAYQVAHGLVRMYVKGWCPAESGMGEDRRILGLRIRRIWVAERYQDS
jgi:lipopolysaccharide transport system ATP-binding protein